jgi:two-component system, NtrC family, nitrogen regulation response regulator GlnG
MTALIWLVDDDKSIRFVLEQALLDAGFQVRAFADAESALLAWQSGHVSSQEASQDRPALVFTDVRMREMDGLQLLKALRQEQPALPVVVMSAYSDLASTVAAFDRGALDFLPKPFDIDDAIALAQRATCGVTLALNQLRPAPAADVGEAMIGNAPLMQSVFRAIGRLSRSELSVLITGETGSGKELVARALHKHSPRASGPFIALNTAAISAELLESELFGHELGAFTGAQRKHIGRFEQADAGTLFLDEIGDMPAALQAKLLRVLAEGEYFSVGGRELRRTNVRVLTATHQDLSAKVQRGEFRADLLHRLNVVHIQLPPLRARAVDIAPLAERFLSVAANEMKLAGKSLHPEALALLLRYPWPGNVRELRNLCLRLAALAPGPQILPQDIALPVIAAAQGDWQQGLHDWLAAKVQAGSTDLYALGMAEAERVMFALALQLSNGERQKAAKLLGIGRNTLSRKLSH